MRNLKNKLKKLKNDMDLSKKYPKYINKSIFWIGFGLFLVFIVVVLTQVGFGKYIYLDCKNKDGCLNPYYVCKEKTAFNFNQCSFYWKYPCEGRNCNTYKIDYNDFIGNKPPKIANNIPSFCLLILILTFLSNHIYYVVKYRWKR